MISWLLVLTTLSGVFAMAYGIFATVHDFHQERKGKRVLSKIGYVGVLILVLSSCFALMVDGYKEVSAAKAEAERNKTENERTKTENVRLGEARARDRQLNDKLGTQLETSQQTSSDLLRALELLNANAQASAAISGNLNRQLGVTTRISRDLGAALMSLNTTSETASAVLAETVDRIDYLEVSIAIVIDPLAMKDVDGKPLFSAEAIRLMSEHNAGRINLWTDEDKWALIDAESKRHYRVIRSQVLEEWSVAITLDRDSGEFFDIFPETVILYERDTGVSAFFTNFTESPDDMAKDKTEPFGLACLVSYRIQPDRYAGFRKYSDLNGADWEVILKINDDFIKVYGAFLSSGFFQNALELSKAEFTRDDDGA